MLKLFDGKYLPKAYQPTYSELEEAVELRKDKRRDRRYLRMHQRLAEGAV